MYVYNCCLWEGNPENALNVGLAWVMNSSLFEETSYKLEICWSNSAVASSGPSVRRAVLGARYLSSRHSGMGCNIFAGPCCTRDIICAFRL